jgi:hypothetical protein
MAEKIVRTEWELDWFHVLLQNSLMFYSVAILSRVVSSSRLKLAALSVHAVPVLSLCTYFPASTVHYERPSCVSNGLFSSKMFNVSLNASFAVYSKQHIS